MTIVSSRRITTVTQREVAARAGVSARTVSNVVNDFPYVAEETRVKVRKALAELGYAPNLAARNLRSGRTGMIALVLPLDVPYFAELTGCVIEEARAHSYAVLIDKTDGDPVREREFIMRGDRSALFDGVIFSPSGVEMSDLSGRSSTIPVVLLGQRIRGGDFDHVMVDNVAASATATRHLISLGRSRIAFIGDPSGREGDAQSDRLAGYRAALREAGQHVRPELEITPGFRREAGAQAMERLLDLPDRPDAVFCYNDPLALGAMRAVLQRGLRVPQDVAIAGFDDTEDGRYTTPTLTTISQDKRQTARYAMDLLVARLGGDTSPPATRHADWRLIERESTLGR